MKHWLALLTALVSTWLLWSWHFESIFLLLLGACSCLICLGLSLRMKIVDSEGTPVDMGFHPFTHYAPWLAKQIWIANIAAAKIILSRRMPLKRNMIEVTANQKTELGHVILANSITLTPGTVSVAIVGDKIKVHALSFEGTAEDLSGEMNRRVCQLEGDA